MPDENGRMREASGSVNSNDPLVSFLYNLMRDHLSVGKVEKILRDSPAMEVHFTNGWLANIAKDQAARLRE